MKKLIILLACLLPAYAADVKLRWDPVFGYGVWQYEVLSQTVGSTNEAAVVAVSVGETNTVAIVTIAEPEPTRFWVRARNAVGVSPRSNMVLWPNVIPPAPASLSIDPSVASATAGSKAGFDGVWRDGKGQPISTDGK
jgi:hypothetical protein